jgi:hypothetical protein
VRIYSVAASLIVLGLATPARAELIFFANGQTMSVKAHRSEGDRLVLSLRGGGELMCDPALVTRIAPDEAPYPEEVIRDSGFGIRADAANPESQTPNPTIDSVPYGALIDKVAGEHGVPARLVRAVIAVESAGQTQARSAKGAMGLMQLMPQTARQYTVSNPYDPATNIEAGVKHLRSLLDRFPLAEALAAYNAGEAAVQRFGGIPPFPETERYVSRILRLAGL